MSRMTPNEWHDARISRVSIVPAPWEVPQPEPETPVGRMAEPQRITTTVPKPRVAASRAPDMFAAHPEDVLRLRMQRLDGIAPDRFPPKIQPKPIGNGHPNSLAGRIRACIEKHGPSTSQDIAKHIGIRPASARNSLSDQRANGRVTFDRETNLWRLT